MIVKTDTETLDFTPMWSALRKWWDDEAIKRIGSWPQKRSGLLLGGPVYGQQFLGIFNNYCLQSAFCGANLEALRGSALMLFTDRAGLNHLPQLRAMLHGDGVDVVVKVIPDEVMSLIRHPLDHMWILGTVHQMTMKEAAHMGYDWHMLVADAVYGDGYFPNLMRLGKEHGAIIQSALTADISAAPLLDKYRTEEGLVIPQMDLGTIGWQFLHSQKKPLVMNGRNDFAAGGWLIYEGQGAVSIYSPWSHVSFLSNELCISSPTILPATVDTQVLALTPNGRYSPLASDGLCVIDLSGGDKPATEDLHLSMDDWCDLMWDRMKFKDNLLQVFKERSEVPVRSANGYSADSIEEVHRVHIEYLIERKPYATMAFCEREVR